MRSICSIVGLPASLVCSRDLRGLYRGTAISLPMAERDRLR